MAQEKIKELGKDVLLKRKKSFSLILGIALGLFLVFTAFMVYDLSQDEFDRSALFGLVSTALMSLSFWLTLRKIEKELKRREDE